MSDPIESPLRTEPPKPRRTLIGPFTARQLGSALVVVVVAAVVLTLVTRPIAPGPGAGATALPAATPFLVGPSGRGAPARQRGAGARGDPRRRQHVPAHGPRRQPRPPRGPARQARVAQLLGDVVPAVPGGDAGPARHGRGVRRPGPRDRRRSRVQETTVGRRPRLRRAIPAGLPIAFDTFADIFHLYKVYALPTQFFIAPDGKIIEVVNGPLSQPATRPPASSASAPQGLSAERRLDGPRTGTGRGPAPAADRHPRTRATATTIQSSSTACAEQLALDLDASRAGSRRTR